MAFKMNGMNFGQGTGSVLDQSNPGSAFPKSSPLKQEDDPAPKAEKKKKRNIFGREREVTKYYDPITGKKIGKEVVVTKKDKTQKTKTKKIKGLKREDVAEGTFRADKSIAPSASPKLSEERAELASTMPEHKDKVTTSETGKKSIPTYTEAYKALEDAPEGGKKHAYDPEKTYKSQQEFVTEAEQWWKKKGKGKGTKKFK